MNSPQGPDAKSDGRNAEPGQDASSLASGSLSQGQGALSASGAVDTSVNELRSEERNAEPGQDVSFLASGSLSQDQGALSASGAVDTSVNELRSEERNAEPGQDAVRIFVSCGELSGDILAAELVSALNAHPKRLEIFGITGPRLRQAGVESIVDQAELAVMGFFEVIKKIPAIQRILRQVLFEVERRSCKTAILVDYPGFHFLLAKHLRLRGVHVVQYVAPKLWAWGEKRASKLRRDFSMVLGVLPFEEKFFCERKVAYRYVGSPHRDRIAQFYAQCKDDLTREDYIGLLPGSRMGEIRRVMPLFIRLVPALLKTDPQLTFVIAVAESLTSEAFQPFLDLLPASARARIRLISNDSLKVMAKARLCILCSGTATLECGLLKTPMLVVYAMNPLSYAIAKWKVKVRFISLVNLILGRELVKEYIQHFDEEKIRQAILDLHDHKSQVRKSMLLGFDEMEKALHPDAAKRSAELIFQRI